MDQGIPPAAEPAEEHLSPGVLGTAEIVFMVIAVTAPLAVVVALMPLAFAFGNGAGIPGTWLVAIGAMFLFALGYIRIIPYVKNAGAFYAYISASLGRTFGLISAYVAVVSYFSLCCSTLGAFAFFSSDYSRVIGIPMPWEVCTALAIVLLFILAYHRITLAAKVLTYALSAEIALVVILGIAVIHDLGVTAFRIEDFAPRTVFAPGLGIALIYAFNSLIGFEGTAIYQEEARNRRVTIPRATFISIILVGLFYVFTAWFLSTAVGSQNVSRIAAADPGHFVGERAREHLGAWGKMTFSVLVLTSSFAAVLGLFNNTTRYIYALARDGVLPRALAKTHARFRSPHIASITLAAVLIAVMGSCALARLHPLLNISTSLVGLGSVGLMGLLAVTSLGIPVFFARQGQVGLHVTVAPGIGGVVILVAVWLALNNYSALTGVQSKVINSLPWLFVPVCLFGLGQAIWLRLNRPMIYAHIGVSRVEEAPESQLEIALS